MTVAGSGKSRLRRFSTSSVSPWQLRVQGAAALLVLLMMAAWLRGQGGTGAGITSASVRLSAGSLRSVAQAAAASAAWLEASSSSNSSAGRGGGSSSHEAGGSDAKPSSSAGDSTAGSSSSASDSTAGSSSSAGDSKAGGGTFATWADELEASRGELPDGPEAEGLPCRASGYCSMGKLGPPYVGEVDSSEGYRKALAASCYKKECIHITIGTIGHLLGLNLASSAWRLGLANVMIHASDKASCDKLAEAGYTNVTCVWCAREYWPRAFSESTQQWGLRYLLVARAVWMGFHVLMLDTDSYIYRDPYAYFKAAPLANISYMSMHDNGNLNNGGAFYVHNFQPHGPVVYTLTSMVDRLIRYNENWEWYRDTHEIGDNTFGHVCQDQPLISDAVASQRLRHPAFPFTMPHSRFLKVEEGQPKLHDRLDYDKPGVHVEYPPAWRDLAGDKQHLHGFQMNIYFLNGTWNETLAGPHFPLPANYTQAYRELLQAEGGVPYWDVEGAPPPRFPGFRDETWIFTPDWLLASYSDRGSGGHTLLEPPMQVIQHVMAVVWFPNTKEYHLKGTNSFNYDVAQALTGYAIPAGTKDAPLPRVLALLPGAHLEAQHSTDFRDKTGRLVKLAMHLGRVLLMPEPVCNTTGSWAVGSENDLGWLPPLRNPATNKTHTRRRGDRWRTHWHGLDDDIHCHWNPHMDKECMAGAYVVTLDYQELLRRLPAGAGAGEPMPTNTVHLGGGGAGRRLYGLGGASRRLQQQHRSESGAGGPSLQAVREAALRMPEPHVLFLGAVPDLSAPLPDGLDAAADERHNQWLETCSFMKEMPRGPWNDEGKKP